MAQPQYDIIVVGAGISGMYATRELLKKYPNYSIALAEKYKGLGGRTYSYSPPDFKDINWEMGAGRIHISHTHVMKLIKEYGLTWIPISDQIAYQSSPGHDLQYNSFETVIIPIYIKPLKDLSPSLLANHTLKELMEKVYGKNISSQLLAHFPYRAEVITMRADMALSNFLQGGELSTNAGYGIIKEGFSELIKRMRADIEERGCTILQRHELLDLKKGPGTATDLDFRFGYEDDPKASGKLTLRANKATILALHKDAVATLPAFRKWKILNYLQCEPLLRIYAIFPVKNKKSWFSGMTRIVSPNLPRYILPINPEKGVIMISYTDADDTKPYLDIQESKGDKALETAVMSDTRKLFPTLKIPKPIFFKSHPWTTGATYWIPGNYNPKEESLKSIHPIPSTLPRVWLCGESWSLRQAWVEGALEQTIKCLKDASKKISI
jgi:hypothetical protein